MCQRVGKFCQGYSSSASQHSAILINKHPPSNGSVVNSLLLGLNKDTQSSWHLRLGSQVLLRDLYGTLMLNGDSICLDVLPQFALLNDAVARAVATFGAVYDAVFILRSQRGLLSASAHYTKALASLYDDLAARKDGPVPAFLASIILAASQVLVQHYTDSLAHIKGAFTVLNNFISPSGTTGASSRGIASLPLSKTIEDRLYIFAQSLDVLIACYVLHRAPQLPASFNPDILNEPSCTNHPQNASVSLQTLIHHCYHVANQASPFKYQSTSKHPAQVVDQQRRCIAYLNQWLIKSDLDSKKWAKESTHNQSRNLYLLLRVQCLSTLIYLSTILSPYETAYDAYSVYFEQIIDCASQIFQSIATKLSTQSHCPFRLQPGLGQALFLTSLKHRNPSQRRTAILLLSKTGIEGPWNSAILCQVARRAVEIEESGSVPAHHHFTEDRSTNSKIPERHRLNGCGMHSEAGNMEANKPVMVDFSLCNDMEAMIQSSDFEDPRHWTLWRESFGAWQSFV